MVPLRSGWLDDITKEYLNCGKQFMGPIIKESGHMNGAGIYPYTFPELCPKTMQDNTTAWDYFMLREMNGMCHDAGHIMQHIWGIHNGQPSENKGPAPSFHSDASMRWVSDKASTLHRCKDGSLIDRLKKQPIRK